MSRPPLMMSRWALVSPAIDTSEPLGSSLTTGGSGLTRNFSLVGEGASGNEEKGLGIQSRIASASL